MYLTYQKYTAIYGPIDEMVFNRLCYGACKQIDKYTTGIDGVQKLKYAFPADGDAVESVSRCTAAVLNFLNKLLEAEKTAESARSYAETENGLQGKVISSITSGNESISFTSVSQKTLVDTAVFDVSVRNKAIAEIVRDHLSGVTDANGVNLLYMGFYPM